MKSLDDNKFGLIVSTDMPAVFDTVLHSILAALLEYYGFSGRLLTLLKSYLQERLQYVKLNTRKSGVTESSNFSVIQGSILSGIPFTLYINEEVRVHRFLEDSTWMEKKHGRKHQRNIKKSSKL